MKISKLSTMAISLSLYLDCLVKPAEYDWVSAMREVHQKFKGQRGTFLQLGDSITVTMAFWAPLQYARKNAPPEMERAFKVVNDYMKPECWRWKGPEFGNEGGKTVKWALEHIDEWLNKLQPEVAVIMFGTNDLMQIDVDEYKSQLRKLVKRCLDNGTIVILTTIPPRSGMEKKSEDFAKSVREISVEFRLPLIDFHSEILKRRPNDWDGASPQFNGYNGYNVPTLISRDGVHPSHPEKYRDDYSEEALNCNGYSLRNYLTLLRYAEVIEKVLLVPEKKKNGQKLPHQSLLPKPPTLIKPGGRVVRVSSVSELFKAVENAEHGDTILIANGHYQLPRRLNIVTDNVTLCGESQDPQKVILDGGANKLGELVAISRCSGVTIAYLTIQNVRWNGLKLDTDTGVHNVTVYCCIFRNIWQRMIKGVHVPKGSPRPRNCKIQYCIFYNERPKTFNGNYIGGIDVMYAQNWLISDNVFVGIQGRTREGRGAIFLWHESENCIVERNIIVDCDVGIALGNSWKPEDVKVHCLRTIVRNNFITRCPESGIVADYTNDCQILHNTIYDPQNRLGRLIRLVHDNDGLFVANNLLIGPPIKNESTSKIRFLGNIVGNLDDFANCFFDVHIGDLHLKPAAEKMARKAKILPEVGEDVDCQPRKAITCVGADEL